MELKQPIRKALKKGKKAYRQGNHEQAARQYRKAAQLMEIFANQGMTRSTELERKKKAVRYRETAKKLEEGKLSREEDGERDPEEAAHDNEEAVTATDSREIRNAVHQLVHHSDVRWDDIGGLEETKEEIKYTLGVTLAGSPSGVEVDSWNKILFYGPPGTGKTLLAAATSNAVRSSEGVESVFFNVTISSILSKYFGESSKIISELYGVARDTSPAVIFLDEIESITQHRDDSDTGAERRLLSTILSELDGLEQKGSDDIYVLTIAATNRPWDLDPAVLSRFEKKIHIPLPDAKAREEILRIHLLERGYESEVPLDQLAELTEGLSGREMEQFCKQVISEMIASENERIPDLMDEGLDAVRAYQMSTRSLTADDFKKAARRMEPGTSKEEAERYRQWRGNGKGG